MAPLRALPALLLLALLAGCAERGAIQALYPAAAEAPAEVEEILVVTTRERRPPPRFFGTERGAGPHYARFDVSVPRDREIGEISWHREGPADPARHFLTLDHAPLVDGDALEAALARQLAALPPEHREVVLFVHGFNTNFAESLYRMAQFQVDFEAPGQAVLFSWPSAASPGGYLYDRDSALIARNALADTLHRLDRVSGGRVTLVGFSMGGFLAVEALRQIGLSPRAGLLARLEGVVLISPDVDLDLFRSATEVMRPMPDPFVVIASRRDPLLRLSGLIFGRQPRLGSVEELRGLEELGVTLIDVTAFGREAASRHTVGLTSPSLIRILRAARGIERSSPGGAPRGAALADIQRRVAAYGR